MNNYFMAPMLAILIFAMTGIPSVAGDREASPDERSLVLAALNSEGCTTNGDIDYEDGVFEAEDVDCGDGKEYEFTLDKEFNIISRQTDD